jgi:hypothetical protein
MKRYTYIPVDRGAFMVAAEHEEIFRVFDFIREQQAYAFQALRTTIHVVAQEKIVGFRGEPSILK